MKHEPIAYCYCFPKYIFDIFINGIQIRCVPRDCEQMAPPHCIICRTDILTPEQVDKLINRKMSLYDRHNLEEEIEKGFMVGVSGCGHTYHEKCLVGWIEAEHEAKCLDALQDIVLEAIEEGRPIPDARILSDIIGSINSKYVVSSYYLQFTMHI